MKLCIKIYLLYFRGVLGGGGGAFFRSRRSLFLIVETTGVYSDPAIVRTRAILRKKTVLGKCCDLIFHDRELIIKYWETGEVKSFYSNAR